MYIAMFLPVHLGGISMDRHHHHHHITVETAIVIIDLFWSLLHGNDMVYSCLQYVIWFNFDNKLMLSILRANDMIYCEKC